MKIFNRKFLYLILLTQISLLFILIPTKAFAFNGLTIVSNDGHIQSGSPVPSPLEPNKAVIRPQPYLNPGQSYLELLVFPDGRPVVKGLGTHVDLGYSFGAGDIFYYNQVGFYNGRPLSLKIEMLKGYNHWQSQIYLLEDGTFNVKSSLEGNVFNMYLVYSDTRERVKDVYLSFPARHGTAFYTNISNVYGYTLIASDGLKQLYYLKDGLYNIDYGGAVSYPFTNDPVTFTKTVDGKEYTVYRAGFLSSKVNYNVLYYMVITDNNYSLSMNGTSANARTSSFILLDPGVLNPFTPHYTIQGSSINNVNDIGIGYNFQIMTYETYSDLYPNPFIVQFSDDLNVFKEFTTKDIVITDQNNKELTAADGVLKQDGGNGKNLVIFSKGAMENLKANLIKISYKNSNFNISSLENKANKLYNASKNQYEIPIKVTATWKDEQGIYRSNTVTQKAIQGGGPFGSAVTPILQYNVGVNTKKLDANKFVKNTKSILGMGDVYATFSEEKEFDSVGTFPIKILLHSTKDPNRVKEINTQIQIKDALIQKSDFDNQEWLIKEIETQIGKKISNTVTSTTGIYISDLKKIVQIDKVADSSTYEGQFIPEGIDYLYKLQMLKIPNKKLGKNLPKSLKNLSNLTTLDVSNNHLVGQIPELNNSTTNVSVMSNQITYNSPEAPPFLSEGFEQTFIDKNNPKKLTLSGKKVINVTSDKQKIKPFDKSDPGYFNLQAKEENSNDQITLYNNHTFTILNSDTKEVLYSGPASNSQTIAVSKDDKLQVIMDEADQNPNNCWNISVEKGDSSITVNFLGEDNQPLTAPVTISGPVGSSINLLSNSDVIERIKEIEDLHYIVNNRPENETNLVITENITQVSYTFLGTIYFKSVPENLSFGSVSLIDSHVSVNQPKYKEPLVVKDIRKEKTPWKLSVTIKQPLTSVQDSKQILYRAIRYKKNDATMVNLSQDEEQLVDQGAISANGEYNVSEKWEKNKSGLVLNVFKNEVSLKGAYQAKLLWKIAETP
ncbi:hypothetical protein A5821_002523 [Enterococcus sp. 7F3_DIV0205]|uniref:WxL domain-containing protein n=1 Tax=Candidatus Enterococcus palustris TaxID=1834189 RepID=A0AAQ3WEX3_9ENTE|nr:hypothetical protein [Enterococcus sp. 7F3_DIV0205]OTN82954.1 hypothetical protein A5821_002877 [Enterococcus sp. 7F3_DIV0205]